LRPPYESRPVRPLICEPNDDVAPWELVKAQRSRPSKSVSVCRTEPQGATCQTSRHFRTRIPSVPLGRCLIDLADAQINAGYSIYSNDSQVTREYVKRTHVRPKSRVEHAHYATRGITLLCPAQAQILESVPVHVHPQRLKLQQIIALAAFHVGADVADTVSTTGWERRCPRCFESGFPLGLAVRKPTVTEMVMLGSGEVTLAALLASKMQRSRHTWIRSMFWLPQSAMITTHSLAVAHNLSLKHF